MNFAALLFGACAAPIFWLGQLMLNYAVTAYGCYPGDHPEAIASSAALRAALYTFDVVAILAAAAGGITAWLCCAKTGSAHTNTAKSTSEGRARFLAIWGLFSSLWFFCCDPVQRHRLLHGAAMPRLIRSLAIIGAIVCYCGRDAATAVAYRGIPVCRPHGAAPAADRGCRAACGGWAVCHSPCRPVWAWILFVGDFPVLALACGFSVGGAPSCDANSWSLPASSCCRLLVSGARR